ncbi:DNA binding domain protein, excisionase family [Rhodomicrobium vannielii ATCC 17100]|jgi:excisionase family DNA binding protein|uniref:DNA binding domain protein, excisionase family n=1 Tax=Rhodomicrobium vannielii (strain ATCC 17100 / DSM 162 / LMG 4299 / NCIMB 10020 / ATH 3.1.1) TaxID=648757 RepID=E3I1L0_RHOVT|nr:helix-turn-helix domain-containing protein [Rhodomicrobium vannielii]ADP72385.1 DNA binding domain protein, excisionase family [Rhodomicrobium vannielii ATCC 17100]
MAQSTSEEKSPRFKPFFTVNELAARWGMSARHVRREIESGALQAHRFGKSIRIAAESVAIYEATRRT